MYEPILELKNLDELEDMIFVPSSSFTKEELARRNALTSACIQARHAERALEAAQKDAIESAAHYARLCAIDEMENAKRTSRRRRAATMKNKEVCTV